MLVDALPLAQFLHGLDNPSAVARHCGQLIQQARLIPQWLGAQRGQAIADLAATQTQAGIATQLGVSPGRIS